MQAHLATVLVFLMFWAKLAFSQNRIQIPRTPKPQTPPITTIEQADQDLKKKRRRRRKRTPPAKKAPKISHIEAMTRLPKKWNTYSQASLIVPYVRTFGETRKDYKAEPGMSFKLEFLLGEQNSPDEISYWLGVRVSPFSGSGTYKEDNGRYSFLYWGPSLSIGKVQAPITKKKIQKNKEVPSTKSWSHWRWSFGISAMSRYAGVNDDFSGGEGELTNSPIGFDAPGLWTEVNYGKIYGKTISLDGSLGLQTGESKIFAYLGIGMGLWH